MADIVPFRAGREGAPVTAPQTASPCDALSFAYSVVLEEEGALRTIEDPARGCRLFARAALAGVAGLSSPEHAALVAEAIARELRRVPGSTT